MTAPRETQGTGFEARLLRAVARAVPTGERAEWMRTWQAELWHLHHRAVKRGGRGRAGKLADFYTGLVLDALWLRGEAWRRRLQGSPALCLGSLAGLNLVALVPVLLLRMGWQRDWNGSGGQLDRSLLAAPLILLVAFAVAPRRHTEEGPRKTGSRWVRRQIFFCAKACLMLALVFLLSQTMMGPILGVAPVLADFVQIFCFVLMALVGVRWAILDQDARCKQCLHALATPAQVGRPSHNLLEWNGVAMQCMRGHGRLHLPELETSWCDSGRWMDVEVC